MSCGLFLRERDDWKLEPAADHFSDLPERNAFLGYSVEGTAFSAVFESKPEDASRIEPMDRRP